MHPEYQYLNLLKEIMENGVDKPIFDSTTKEVMPDKSLRSVFGRQLTFDLSQGFPIYTTKKTFYKGAFQEMLWFLEGSGDIAKLARQGCKIWNEWAYKDYLTCIKNTQNVLPEDMANRIADNFINVEQNDIGNPTSFEDFTQKYLLQENSSWIVPLHYTNYTNWNHKGLDQVNWVVENIVKRPERKSYYVTAWNPEEAYQMAEQCGKESVVIVACHLSHLLNISDGRISMMVTIRSNDMFLGNPFNVAQYAMLLHMYSFLTGFPVGDLVISIGDAHLYYNHFDQAKEQISREPRPFPKMNIRDRGQKKVQDFVFEDFTIEDYNPHPALKGEVTVVGGY